MHTLVTAGSAIRRYGIAGKAVTQATISHPVCLYTIRVVGRRSGNVVTDLLTFVFLVKGIVVTPRQARDWCKKVYERMIAPQDRAVSRVVSISYLGFHNSSRDAEKLTQLL